MGAVAAVFAAVAGTIMLAWQWLGSSVAMPPSPFSRGEKIPCISYAPFRGSQSPFGADVPIDPGRISAPGERVGVIVSGGNVGVARFCELLGRPAG